MSTCWVLRAWSLKKLMTIGAFIPLLCQCLSVLRGNLSQHVFTSKITSPRKFRDCSISSLLSRFDALSLVIVIRNCLDSQLFRTTFIAQIREEMFRYPLLIIIIPNLLLQTEGRLISRIFQTSNQVCQKQEYASATTICTRQMTQTWVLLASPEVNAKITSWAQSTVASL